MACLSTKNGGALADRAERDVAWAAEHERVVGVTGRQRVAREPDAVAEDAGAVVTVAVPVADDHLVARVAEPERQIGVPRAAGRIGQVPDPIANDADGLRAV